MLYKLFPSFQFFDTIVAIEFVTGSRVKVDLRKFVKTGVAPHTGEGGGIASEPIRR